MSFRRFGLDNNVNRPTPVSDADVGREARDCENVPVAKLLRLTEVGRRASVLSFEVPLVAPEVLHVVLRVPEQTGDLFVVQLTYDLAGCAHHQ